MNLADWLRRTPRPALGEQLALAAALAQAVEDGHRAAQQYAGWSPSRIKIKSDGGVDLTAINAEAREEEDLAYSAPETAGGRDHSPRSDVYSAGVILYEILAGVHPFGGASVQQPRGAAKPLSEVRRDLPQDLADAITACLERDPNWRPADLSFVLQVARETAGKAGGKAAAAPVLARRTAVAAARRDAGPSPTFAGRPASSSPPSRLPVIIAGVLIVISAGVAFWMFRRPSVPVEPGNPTAAPATPVPATPPAVSPAAGAPTKLPAGTKPTVAAVPTPTTGGAGVTPAPIVATAAVAATTAPIIPTLAPVASTPPPPPVTTAVAARTPAPPPLPAKTDEPSAGPVVLRSLSPLKVRRGYNALLDLHGENLRADTPVSMTKAKGKSEAGDIMVIRRKLVDPTLLQVLINVAANASTGAYVLVATDAQGHASLPLSFEVTQ
jgi:Protein kinase domain